MSTPSIDLAESVLPPRDPRIISAWQRLYWSVRREVWEYRSLWLAPAVFSAGALVVAVGATLPALPETVALLTGSDPAVVELRMQRPYAGVALTIFAAAFMAGVFYCLEALQGERRDRSILFWKSIPISDRTTVLSKVVIPLVVLPLVAYVLCVLVYLIMLVLSCTMLFARGGDVRTFLAHLALVDLAGSVLYGVIVIALWHAPIYAWLLFLSSWAGRSAVVWATAPFVALGTAELTGLSTSKIFSTWIPGLAVGWLEGAFVITRNVGTTSLVEPAPGALLRQPHLWIGLVFGAACIAGAVYMRRHRESN